MNGSARTRTSKSVMCRSGRPLRASAAQYHAVRPTIRWPEIRPSRASGVHAANTHSSIVGSEVAAVVVFVGEHDQADYEP